MGSEQLSHKAVVRPTHNKCELAPDSAFTRRARSASPAPVPARPRKDCELHVFHGHLCKLEIYPCRRLRKFTFSELSRHNYVYVKEPVIKRSLFKGCQRTVKRQDRMLIIAMWARRCHRLWHARRKWGPFTAGLGH